MNVLQLSRGSYDRSNIGYIFSVFGSIVINKDSIDILSLNSYDLIIITEKYFNYYYEDNSSFFKEVEKLNKIVIYVYNSTSNKDNSNIIKYLKERFKISILLSDCSIMEKNAWNYEPNNENGEAYSLYSKNGECFCNIKNTKQYYIFKNSNVFVMHDLKVTYRNGGIVLNAGLSRLVKYFEQLDINERNSNIEWLNNIQILDDEELHLKYESNQNTINKINDEQEIINKKICDNNTYKSILYKNGDALVDSVKKILEEMLNIKIDDTDYKKQDLFFKLDDVYILVEIKGVNHPFKRENVSQAKRHVTDYADKNKIYGSDIEEKCKGVLILNPYDLGELKDRISKEFYSKEVINDAEYHRICTIDTFTLLSMYSKFKNNSNNVNLKKIILESNYNEPDYDDIIKL